MFSCLPRVNLRETLIPTAVAVLCLFEPPIAGASPPAQPTSAATTAPDAGFIVLTQPVKLKIAYGDITLPAGMRLPVVSSDTTSVRVNYMGEVQTIPIAAVRFETSTNNPLDAAAASTAPIT